MRRAAVLLLLLTGCRAHPTDGREFTSQVCGGSSEVLRTVGRAFATSSSLVPAAGGYRLAHAGALDTTLPSSASGAVRLSVTETVWLELASDELAARPAELIAGALVFRAAATDTDVVWLGATNGVEELRVLESPRASSTMHHRLRLGPDVGVVRVVDGNVVEVLDRAGVIRLRTAPMFAVDARGVRRDLVARLQGDVLETKLDTAGLQHPIVIDPAWSAVGSMSTARSSHTATTLAADAVLVTGGVDATGARLSTAELYDPAAKTWSAVPAMSSKRAGHTATLLSSGKVLVVGGTPDGNNAFSTAQLFDPSTKSWSAAASMTTTRSGHTATLLTGDKVLVVGGSDMSPGGEQASAELWDAATNTWSAAGTMTLGRQEHTATLLSGGKVLIAGGRHGGGNHYSSAELFDVSTKTWSSAGTMASGRSNHAAALLSGDRVLVMGGWAMDSFGTLLTLAKAEVFDLATKTWKATGSPMTTSRVRHSANVLPLDRVLVVGGDASGTVDLYDASTDRFTSFVALATGRNTHRVAQLSTQDLLVTGGTGSTASLASVELLTVGPNGAACKDGHAECASGLCVDGVCCNAACTGQCEGCNVAGKEGTCTPVVGAPRGARTACSDGAGSVCKAQHCDGVERKSCAGYADPTVVCAPAACADGSAKPAAKCDGLGNCPATAGSSCAPYACGDGLCKSTCVADTDCTGSNVCDKTSGKCVPESPTCTTDGLSSQPSDRTQPAKSCAPYRCNAATGRCFDTCSASDACAPGLSCDPTTHTCVPSSGGGDDSGCALGTPTRARGVALSFLVLALTVAARRRRSVAPSNSRSEHA